MKQDLTITTFKKVFQPIFIFVVLFITLLIPGYLFAQADSTQKQEPATEQESSLISPSLEFVSVQKTDNTIDLKVALKAKFKGSSIKLPLLKTSFLLITDTAEKELGFVITNSEGKAVLNVKADVLTADKEGKLHFKAVFAGNKAMEATEQEVTIKRARLEITPVKEDSLLIVQVKLIDVGTGTETPVPETVVGIFVHRSFNPLKIGEGSTDENGEATIEVPNKLPGDAKGNITLIAKLDENELYGNLEAGVVQQWGVPVSDKSQELPRALWSPHAPLWMMITFIILICTVWGHYLVIIIQLFRLRREEPEPDSPTVEHIS
ncbi:MAG: hypothetical protein HZB42_11340 [Sphingobacteriales bacterium]|nr:hypothetical protein [Sphingobacteriales bacterium]